MLQSSGLNPAELTDSVQFRKAQFCQNYLYISVSNTNFKMYLIFQLGNITDFYLIKSVNQYYI